MEGGKRTRGIFRSTGKDFPLISIITVVYNRKTFLEQTILSVLNQTYRNIEYIIVDGGSTDGSLEIIKQYDDRIDYWVSEPDKGMYFALNKGISLANGDLIGVCHSDDYYYVNTVVEQLADQYIKEEVDIYHGDMMPLLDDGTFGRVIESESDCIIKTNNSIVHPSTFIKRSVFMKLGLYNTIYRSASDYELMLRCFINGCMFKHLGMVVTVMRISDQNRISNNCFSLKEDYRIHRNLRTGYSFQFIKKYLYCRIHSMAKRFGLSANKMTINAKIILRKVLVK